MSLADLFRS
jgi:hypothetical protein